MSRGGAIAATFAAAAGLAAAPAAAGAATIAVDRPCYAEEQTIAVTGSGFTPNAAVKLTFADGSYGGQVTADAAGNVSGSTGTPPLMSGSEAATTITATDQANAANAATVPLRISKLSVSTKPTRARPHSKIRYRARGFTTGGVLYGHYLLAQRLRKTVRVGRLNGPCGSLTRRMSLLPLHRIRYGLWTVQFDTAKRYSRRTTPSVRGSLLIFRHTRTR